MASWPAQVWGKDCETLAGYVRAAGGAKRAETDPVCNRMWGLSPRSLWLHYTESSSDLHGCSSFIYTVQFYILTCVPLPSAPPPRCASPLRVLQPSPARPGSSWRCRLRSAPRAQREATPSAAASALTNGIPCLLDSVAWQPHWSTTPTETRGSPATGGQLKTPRKKTKSGSKVQNQLHMCSLAVLPGCLREAIWSPTGMNARSLSSMLFIWRNKALSASSTSMQTTTCYLSSLWVSNMQSVLYF